MHAFVCVIEFIDDELGEAVEQRFFGPFASHEEGANFGERYITDHQDEREECGIGWSVNPLIDVSTQP